MTLWRVRGALAADAGAAASVGHAHAAILHVVHHRNPVRRPQYVPTVPQPIGQGNKLPHGRARAATETAMAETAKAETGEAPGAGRS